MPWKNAPSGRSSAASMIKGVILFLAAMVGIGFLGRWIGPQRGRRAGPPVCRDCGRYIVGRGGCVCRKGS